MNASRGARGEVEDEAREEAFLDRLVRRARRVGAGDGRKGEMRRRSEMRSRTKRTRRRRI